MTELKATVSHRVLLVDDDDQMREMMTLTLEHKGFDVVPAATVNEALRLISTERFDVLLTDLHMPNPSDGFAVVTQCDTPSPMLLPCWSAATPT
jgi:CheY-like chemotaxis protein